jgi:type IV pilus assembly protein PilN
MPRINLLPWREEQRKERKLAFFVGLGGAALAAAIATFAGYLLFNSLISAQQARNDRLRAEITTLDRQIEEINSLEQDKQKFIARMEIIDKLQRSRPEIVHVFDTLVKTVPDGTYLTAVQQTDKKFKITGITQSATRVATFMRNIDGSQWLKNAELDVLETKKENRNGSEFVLFAEQVTTADDDSTAAPKTVAQRRPQ